MESEGFEGERAVLVKCSYCGPEVGRTSFEADETEHGQDVGKRLFVARRPFDELGHSGGIGQDQGEHTGMAGGNPLLGRRQAGDLGDQDTPVGVVGVLQSEILAPVEQDVGGGVSAEEITEPAKLGGMLFVEEKRLQVETVEQYQAAEAVGAFDRLGVPPEPLGHARDQLANRRRVGRVFRRQIGFRARRGFESSSGRGNAGGGGRHQGRPVTRADGLERQLDQDAQGGDEHRQGYGSLHG